MGKEVRILLIDDGSSDNSAHMLVRSLTSGERPSVSILLNRDPGNIVQRLWRDSVGVSGDLILTLDANLQNPPEEIPRLVAKSR
ncbi:glycosyltransferase [Escherichia coli]